MKRKWIALVCVLALMLCLTACGEEETVSVTGMVVSVDGTVVTLMEMDQENMNFRGMEDGQMPSMPEGGEMPDFSGSFVGMMGSMGGINFDGKTQQIDIGDARIGVEIEGGKESGSLDDLAPGAFVTVTMTAKGKVTFVLVTSTSGMTGFGGFGNFMGMSRS